MIFCAVAGVQSQSITVDRQLKRYHVPRIAFVNKCDRQGANPLRVCAQIREKLGLNAYMMELPIGLEDKLQGVVDLVAMKAIYFDGDNGENLRYAEIPADLVEQAKEKRVELLDAASMFDDDLMAALMEEGGYDTVPEETVILEPTITPPFALEVALGSLAAAIVPLEILEAFKEVKEAPDPTKEVALNSPVDAFVAIVSLQ